MADRSRRGPGRGGASGDRALRQQVVPRACSDPLRRETIRGVEVERVRTTGLGSSGRLGRVVDAVSFIVGVVLRLTVLPRADLVVSLTSPPMIPLLG
jgi:hypothetical protein